MQVTMSQLSQIFVTEENLYRNIRAIGLFHYFGAFMIVFGAVGSLVIFGMAGALARLSVRQYLAFAVLFGLSAFYFLLGRGLRKFRSWARIVSIVLCCIALGAIPFGTILGGAFLYVLLKAKPLFSAARLEDVCSKARQ